MPWQHSGVEPRWCLCGGGGGGVSAECNRLLGTQGHKPSTPHSKCRSAPPIARAYAYRVSNRNLAPHRRVQHLA